MCMYYIGLYKKPYVNELRYNITFILRHGGKIVAKYIGIQSAKMLT